MKSFIEFLREDTDPPTTLTSFSDKATGVNSYFHLDNKTGDAYWGYQVPDGKGGHTDIPPEGLSPEAKSGISRAARDQMTRYRKANPGTNITSQYNPGAQGEANWKFWQGEDAKLKATNPEITGSFTRLTPKPSTKPGLGLGGKLGIAGAALGLATGASAADLVHGLNPLSVLDGGSLGTNDDPNKDAVTGEPIDPNQYNFLPPKPIEAAEPKPLSKPIPKNYSY